MRSIERRFKKIEKKNSDYTTYLCFAEAVRGQRFRSKTIRFWFNRLVDKDDYDKRDKKLILTFLYHMSNHTVESDKS